MMRSWLGVSTITLLVGCGGNSAQEPGPSVPDVQVDSGSGGSGGSPAADAQTGTTGGAAPSDASADVTTGGRSVVYVGSGDGNLYQYSMDPTTGKLTQKSSLATGNYPSFMAMSPDSTHAYACNEADGTLASISVNTLTGALSSVSTTDAAAADTFVSTDRTGKWVFTANYNAGSVMVFPTTAGVAGAAKQTVTTGQNPHAIITDPSNQFVFVPCKGSDRIEQYKLDAATGTLTPNTPASVTTAAGAGPRHIAFHPNGKYVYVIAENNSTMAAYTFDAVSGTLTLLGTPLSTLPSGTSATGQTGAEVVVAPSGKFVYGSNRSATGENSIVIYAVDASTGNLTFVGTTGTGGKTPRSFAIDPAGTFLFAANQDSKNVVAFRIDASQGTLTKLDTTTIPDLAYFVGVFALP